MNDILLTLAAQAATDGVSTWTDWVREAGGWGVAVVEFMVLGYVFRTHRADIKEKDDKIISVLEKQNEALKSLRGG